MIPDIDKTILVVEDQEDARAALSGFLEAKGYIVACAENGLAALDEIKTRKPRLILLDLAMPVMDGYTFMNQARQIFASFPEAKQVVSQIGRPDDGTDTGGFGNTEYFIDLKPKAQWRPIFGENKERLIAAMNREIAKIPGAALVTCN